MKGLRYLLEALAKLRVERPDLHLVVIGKRKVGGASDQTIQQLGLEDAVEFVTGVPEQRIIELYSEAAGRRRPVAVRRLLPPGHRGDVVRHADRRHHRRRDPRGRRPRWRHRAAHRAGKQ